jgi:hypothetical protein
MRDQYAKPLEEKYKLVREALDVRTFQMGDVNLKRHLDPLLAYLMANPEHVEDALEQILQPFPAVASKVMPIVQQLSKELAASPQVQRARQAISSFRPGELSGKDPGPIGLDI